MSTAIEYDGFALSRKIYPKLENSDHLTMLAEKEQKKTINLADLARLKNRTQTTYHLDNGTTIEPIQSSKSSAVCRRNLPSHVKEILVDGCEGFVRINYKLNDEETESTFQRTRALLSHLEAYNFCVHPIATLRYTGKKGLSKIKEIIPKMEGNLNELLQETSRFNDLDELKKLAAQIILILYHVEDIHNVYHRNIKLEKFLYSISEEGHLILKLNNFRFARGPKDDGRRCGSPRYVAPEMLDKDKSQSTDLSDVWATGVMLFPAGNQGHKPLFSNYNPVRASQTGSDAELLMAIETTTDAELSESLAHVEDDYFRDLLKKMIVRDVDKRYSFTELLLSSFFVQDGLLLLKQERHPIVKFAAGVMPLQ